MAETQGLVQKLKWTSGVSAVFIYIGPTATTTTLFFIVFASGDSEATLGFKRNMVYLLEQAQLAGDEVTVVHDASSAEVQQVLLGTFAISPVGEAIHGDFYSVTGAGFPPDARLVFERGGVPVSVTPDLVRPHLLYVSVLPASIPVGRTLLRVTSASGTSAPVPVTVSDVPPYTIRVLHSGAPRPNPYTIVFAANGAIESETGGSFTADPVLTNRPGYHAAVTYCLQNMLLQTEDLLRAGNLDAEFRIVSIFDPTLTATAASSLVHEVPLNIIETRRSALVPFVARYSETADIVMAITGSTTHTRASAWFTTDDASQPGTPFTYDGVNRTHGHFPSIPGSAALPVTVSTGMTPLHEFGHACSDFNNGMVVDLYVDGSPGGFQENKKFRATVGAAIPVNFAIYNGTTYQSDQNRDALGYPATWRSYHPALIDPTRPNLMDNYWLAFDSPLRCRLDLLTYAFLTDRIRAKAFR
jgi:hypothetical protein